MQPDRRVFGQNMSEQDHESSAGKLRCIAGSGVATLYHGSKSGIHGGIAPVSRQRCDFGRGFYMGTVKAQSLTLICNYPEAVLYTLQADLSGLSILQLEADLDWAMFVAYHRGKLESVRDTGLYRHVSHLADGADMIVGTIANDRMFVVLDRFFNGDITDAALIHCLSALKLGQQYAAVTQKACRQINILGSHVLGDAEREKRKLESAQNRSLGISAAEEICRNHRREGRYFDEILAASK